MILKTFLSAVVIPAVFFIAPGLQAYDKTGCEMNCQKCHTVKKEEIGEILKKLKAPDAEIVKVEPSEMKGVWEVSIINKGQPRLFYLDFSKEYVISGSVIDVKSGKNKTVEKIKEVQDTRKVDFSKIPLDQMLVIGDVASAKKVAVFTDPD